MAHHCPTCNAVCHCGGDDDDQELEDTLAELNCTHCPDDDDDGFEFDDDDAPATDEDDDELEAA